jgi:glycosyltransferase involved in cell wall biosynthesis
MDPQVSIITRCRNRLEFTVQVVDAVKRLSDIDYEHIIVDNGSTDGTYEWFRWISEHCSWFGNIKYVRIEGNTGDWGGMLYGATIAKGKYIVQLDNDIIPCQGWLSAMVKALEETTYEVIMLRRENVAWKLKPLSVPVVVDGLHIVRVERAVACYIMKRVHFDMCANYIPAEQGAKSKYIMAGLTKRWKGLKIGKILNRTCIELQADDQRQKYSPKNPQIWEKI